MMFKLNTTGFIVLGSFIGYFSVGLLVIAGILGFIIAWELSELFIPPRDYLAKAAVAVFTTRIGIGIAGAYFAVIGTAYLLSMILEG